MSRGRLAHRLGAELVRERGGIPFKDAAPTLTLAGSLARSLHDASLRQSFEKLRQLMLSPG